jgi:hypothetical protein
MPAGPEWETFSGIVMGIIFLVGGFSIVAFLYSALHEKIGSSDPKDKTSKVVTGIVLAVLIFTFFALFFGGNN